MPLKDRVKVARSANVAGVDEATVFRRSPGRWRLAVPSQPASAVEQHMAVFVVDEVREAREPSERDPTTHPQVRSQDLDPRGVLLGPRDEGRELAGTWDPCSLLAVRRPPGFMPANFRG